MKNLIRPLSLLAVFASGHALATWEVGVSVNNLTESADIIEDSNNLVIEPIVNIVTVSAAYQFEVADNLFVVPEISYGVGLADDSEQFSNRNFVGGNFTANISHVDFEIDQFAQLAIRLEHHFDNGVYFYLVPSYATFDFTADVAFVNVVLDDDSSATDNELRVKEEESNFGVGLGFGYQISEALSAEVSYQNFDDADVLSIGAKYAF